MASKNDRRWYEILDTARAKRLSAEVRKLVKELYETRSMYGDSHSNFGNQAKRAADMLLSMSAQLEAANARAEKAEAAEREACARIACDQGTAAERQWRSKP